MKKVSHMQKIAQSLVSSWLPIRPRDIYKNKLGRVLCIGGNENMGGAIILAGGAALNSGAGLVTIASHQANRSALHARHPEIMFVDYDNSDQLAEQIKIADTILLGPGLGREKSDQQLVQMVLDSCTDHQSVIIDADGLYHLAHLLSEDSHFELSKQTILTPHLGEWEKLTHLSPADENITDNIAWRDQLNAAIVLKKERTEIYLTQECWQNTAGNPSMATGGMGDTLAGMIAGFIGQYENKKQAILSAVYLHSYIADQLAETHYVTLPSQIIAHIPEYMAKFKRDKEEYLNEK